MTVQVLIRHCSGWGYAPRAQKLRDAIVSACPAAQVQLEHGERTSFEISINGQLIFSKLQTGGFPETEDLIKAVQEVEKVGKCATEVRAQKSTCTML